MTRTAAIRHHETQRRRANRLARRLEVMRDEMRIVLSVHVRPSDNDPALMLRVTKIYQKYTP